MPRFTDLPHDFCCPYRDGCPYLEGLPTRWVWRRNQDSVGLECHYEHQLEALQKELAAERRQRRRLEQEKAELQAQLQALHRRQFKGRTRPLPPPPAPPGGASERKKRGAPVGHPPWQRRRPKHVDQTVVVPAPDHCPHCGGTDVRPVEASHQHVQEDIVLEPRTIVTAFAHQQVRCAACDQLGWQPGPGELPGAYLGPATKATAIYLRHELNVSERKIARFFKDFFGLRFVPASVFGFEKQAVRRGAPLHEDLRQKLQALPVVHADETSWRHDGQSYWVWYAGDDDLAYFHWDAHRTTEAAQSVLGEKFDGILIADALASYNGVHPKDRQSCLAHIKTKAKELEQELALLKGRAADPDARVFCQDIQSLMHDICAAHRRLCQKPWRAKKAKAAGRPWRARLQNLCSRPLRHPRAEAFRQRLAGREQKNFFTCFRHRGVPPTNNQAERSLRPVVIMRKVIQGTRSEQGLVNHSVLRSRFETARRQGRKAHEFFVDLFTKNTDQAQAALYRKSPNGKPRPP